MFWHFSPIILLSILKLKNGLKLIKQIIFPRLMSVMTNGLRKDIIAQKFALVWTVPVSAIPGLYQPKLWVGLQSLVMVIRVRRLWNQTTRVRSVLFNFFTL